MLTYVGNDWSGYNIYYIAMKKPENALDIGRSASDGSNSLVKTPLHLIRWGSKTSGLSSTLNYMHGRLRSLIFPKKGGGCCEKTLEFLGYL